MKKIALWGFLLWLFGYALGFLLFAFVPKDMLGWYIMPLGIVATVWVLAKKVPSGGLRDYLEIGAVWTIIAVVCDYLFLVQLLKPTDGYYKLDVYLYYVLTFLLPVVYGLFRLRK